MKTYISNINFYEKLDQGYAIPERITVRFSDEQKNYLVKLFEQGELDKTKRARAEAVEKDMILKFPLNLVLEESQIVSYFSKLCSSRKKKQIEANKIEPLSS